MKGYQTLDRIKDIKPLIQLYFAKRIHLWVVFAGEIFLFLGRPKCILETNRVDLRPEKSAVSSDFEEGKLGFRGRGAVVVVGTPGAGLDAF